MPLLARSYFPENCLKIVEFRARCRLCHDVIPSSSDEIFIAGLLGFDTEEKRCPVPFLLTPVRGSARIATELTLFLEQMTMGRPKRADAAGHCYHMLNRANLRDTIFQKPEDYDAFERILGEAIERFDVRLFSYCVMPNHWHLVVSPGCDGEMGRFGQWVGLTHTQRYHAHYRTAGMGHLYQGRYKSFPVQSDEHFLTVCRYTERNAYHASLCTSPELWKWGSLHHWSQRTPLAGKLLSSWPVSRRQNWIQWVETDFTKQELEKIHWSVKRGVPFGDETWVEHIVRKYDLESTMRPRGRPKKSTK